ncbi:MAG: bifunctional nuclease family protein [Planctomycetota bacterium]
MIEVELVRIIIRESMEQPQYIFLREKGGEREFPIIIGYFEAAEINRKIRQVPTQRPMTHDLIGGLLEVLGGELKHVVVSGLSEGTFYAKIFLSKEGEEHEVDCRPSDAIALAAQFRRPIFVAESVLKQAAT